MVEAAIIGVGNPLRGDDGAGRAVATRLKGVLPPTIEIWECPGGAVELLEMMGRARRVIVVDAVSGDGLTGEVLRLGPEDPLPETTNPSTHGLGLAEAIGFARALGKMPKAFEVIGIRGDRFEMGATMSARVNVAVDEVVRLLVKELGEISLSKAEASLRRCEAEPKQTAVSERARLASGPLDPRNDRGGSSA